MVVVANPIFTDYEFKQAIVRSEEDEEEEDESQEANMSQNSEFAQIDRILACTADRYLTVVGSKIELYNQSVVS